MQSSVRTMPNPRSDNFYHETPITSPTRSMGCSFGIATYSGRKGATTRSVVTGASVPSRRGDVLHAGGVGEGERGAGLFTSTAAEPDTSPPSSVVSPAVATSLVVGLHVINYTSSQLEEKSVPSSSRPSGLTPVAKWAQ